MPKQPTFSYQITVVVIMVFFALSASAADPPAGWSVTGNQSQDATGITPADGGQLEMTTNDSIELPVECTVRMRLPSAAAAIDIKAVGIAQPDELLRARLSRRPGNELYISVSASGKKMAAVTKSSRYGFELFTNRGNSAYGWRFQRVRNLWDERDRADIGTDYERLTPFNDKVFVVRMIITTETRQIWIDDRLVAEQRMETSGPARLSMKLMPGAVVLSVNVKKNLDYGPFLPMHLEDYYKPDSQSTPSQLIEYIKTSGDVSVPVQLIDGGTPEIDLGNSLYRYRLTHGTGPDTGYVNGMSSWPNPLRVDPAIAAFRVPHRDYRNVWLVAWVDDDPGAVARGALRFYRDKAGFAAQSDFEISKDTIEKGLVKQLNRRTRGGKPLYLIRVPVETDAFYGFCDLADQFIDFQISKPLHPMRSYPDPIYYGSHPGGPPSSIHVVGITLEEAPFGYHVKPHQYGHVFEKPENPAYTVVVTNHSDGPLESTVRIDTRSYDGTEENQVTGSARIEVGEKVEVELNLDKMRMLGWHEMKVTVEAAGVARSNTLSLVLLPPNRRTYGNAANETRFGMWNLMGHYIPLTIDKPSNEPVLAMFRKLGFRRMHWSSSVVAPETALKYDLLPTGPHTISYHAGGVDENDPNKWQKMLDDELNGNAGDLKRILEYWPEAIYNYGGEWGIEFPFTHVVNPRYTGQGPYQFTEVGINKLKRDTKIFTAIGRMLREKAPSLKLILQWGCEMDTIPFLEHGFPKDLVDGYGLDMPMFEQTPEIPVALGTVNRLWAFRQEVKRLGWPQLGIYWVEGPFLPTNDGALTEREQEQNYIRHWLLGLAYGVESFESGVVPHDAGNYYGSEHYGAGVFHRVPLENPKPVVAAMATATSMLCGADVVGPIDTGVLTTFCLSFRHGASGRKIYALWRVRGQVDATLEVVGAGPAIVTDAMGNSREIAVKDDKISIRLSPSPIWLTGIEKVKGFEFASPTYETAPAKIVRPLPSFTSGNWTYDGSPNLSYANNHFSVARLTDDQLTVTFEPDPCSHGPAARIHLSVQPAGDRTLAARYGSIALKEPAVINGKAQALGLWVKGNSSWGRVVFQLRDARGEIWTSIGTKNDWNCDDTHTWSFVNFEGWRYVRFPLPGNLPYDMFRERETTWWKSEEGDGIVDLPLRLERLIVEARNEVHYLGKMLLVPDRSYKIAGLVAEYATEDHTQDDVLALYRSRRATPEWQGPSDNPMARMREVNNGQALVIRDFEEPPHWKDGRRMVIRFDEQEGRRYNLYLSRHSDGRGAEQLSGQYKDGQMVYGLRPGIDMYFFLTAVGPDGNESKPSRPFWLVTEDKFLEK